MKLRLAATPVELRLAGDLGIEGAAELKAALVEALAAGRGIRVQVAEVTHMDVTAVQLLWAAERATQKQGQEFTLDGQLPDAVRAGLAAAGLDRLRPWAP